MKKTFRKALASILAVLMVICSIPFMANAEVGKANHQWWTDADLPITATPDYTPWSTASSYTFGKEITAAALQNGAAKRWNYKPIFAVTVSDMGTAESSYEEMDACQENYYGAGANGFTDAKAAGVILNPTDLKAGQRIAVTFEYAGVDVLNAAQILADFDSDCIVPGGYWDLAVDNECDTWENNLEYAKSTANPYTCIILNAVVFAEQFNATWVSTAGAGSNGAKSNFIGKNNAFDSQFGGIISNTIFFEVKKDCDLSQVIKWRGKECFISPIYMNTLTDDLDYMSFDPTNRTSVLVAPIIWTGSAVAEPGYSVTVEPYNNGTVTINDITVDNQTGMTVDSVQKNSIVTLVATPDEGATFLGWKANDGTTVSTDTTLEALVNANITYTPVFAKAASEQIILTFVDAFGNIYKVDTMTKGDSSYAAPAVPERAGYTANGWDVTDFTALTTDTTVHPVYVKDATQTYSVTVADKDATITCGNKTGVVQGDSVVLDGLTYNSKVTVSKTGAGSWKIGDSTVAYGESYTFFVGSDVTLTPAAAVAADAQKPIVGSVAVSKDGNRVSFIATREIEGINGCTQINAGFIYGKGEGVISADTELVNVDGSSVKAVYTKTEAKQFSIVFTAADGTTYGGRAFITYKDSDGAIQVAYAEPQSYKNA